MEIVENNLEELSDGEMDSEIEDNEETNQIRGICRSVGINGQDLANEIFCVNTAYVFYINEDVVYRFCYKCYDGTDGKNHFHVNYHYVTGKENFPEHFICHRCTHRIYNIVPKRACLFCTNVDVYKISCNTNM